MFEANDYSWAAGFLDGEGCFTLNKGQLGANGERRRTSTLYVSQKRSQPLDKLQIMFGGYVYNYRLYEYKLTGTLLRPALECVIPYLVLKRDEAELLLTYSMRMQRHWGRAPIPQEEHEARTSLEKQLRACKELV